MAEVKEVNAEKLKALQLTMDRLEKSYGKGTIMRLGDAPILDIDGIPTGSLNVDLASLKLIFPVESRITVPMFPDSVVVILSTEIVEPVFNFKLAAVIFANSASLI